MNSTAIHGRHRYIQGLRDLADWLETDATTPCPAELLVIVRLPDPGAVERFARLHRLAAVTVDAHGQTYTSKRFGPVTYRPCAKPGRGAAS